MMFSLMWVEKVFEVVETKREVFELCEVLLSSLLKEHKMDEVIPLQLSTVQRNIPFLFIILMTACS